MNLTPEERKFFKDKFLLWKEDIQAFGEFFFPHLLNRTSAAFQKEIYRDLSKAYPFSAYEVFRGGGKSTIGLIIKPIHFALFKPLGDISLISKSESFVLNEINRKIKSEFENNEKLIQFFGNQKTEKWSESYFVLKNGIAFEGMGIGGQLRGGRRGLIMLDDLEDEETAISEEQRDKLRRRINKELIPKLLPEAEMAYFGTPIHQLAYIHQIITTPDNGWHKRIYSAYVDSKQEAGKERWKEMFPHDRLQMIKSTMGTNYFSGEYLCNPIADENVPIKEGQIKTWTKKPKKFSCVLALDPAYSEDSNSDYKVAVVVGTDEENNRYLFAYVRTHAPQLQYWDMVAILYRQWKEHITAVGAPNGGGDKEFFRGFTDYCIKNNIMAPCELKNTFTTATGDVKRNKKARVIAALQPHFERGQYFIHPEHMEARDELLTIGASRWDDLVDAMSYAESIIQPIYYETTSYEDESIEQEKINHGDTGYGL